MTQSSELRRSVFASALLRAYGIPRLQHQALSLAGRLEGGQFYSSTMRAILLRYHQVEIGAYSYGACFDPGAFPAGAQIGRYVSIASGVRRRLNHPLDKLVLHPFFYNEKLGFVSRRMIEHRPISIGHDAWIGEAAIFTEGCSRVGVGAVVGAGSVVTRDVDDFTVVAGSPARVLRKRFDDDTCARILASAWWLMPVGELSRYAKDLAIAVADWPAGHALLGQGPASPDNGAGRLET